MSRIALIAPRFFGYRERVAVELQCLGYEVDCFDDRPSESTFFKSVAKLGYKFLEPVIEAYADKLAFALEAGGYTRVVYMGGMSFCFSRDQLSKLRRSCDAVFVAYLWDALDNCKRLSACIDQFDKVMSFEPGDCRDGVSLRPLFFGDSYSELPVEPEGGFEYDACFIGSTHQPSKFRAVKAMCAQMESQGLRVFKYFFMPSLPVEILRRTTDNNYRGVKFEHEPLPADRVAEIISKSRAIIDSPQSGQRGLTMRTLEAVGAHRKLITANPDVENYDFFRYGDVAVWRGNSIDNEFFVHPFNELPGDIYSSYSIAAFARSLVGEREHYSGYVTEGGNQ